MNRGGHSVTISVTTSLGIVVLPTDPRFMGVCHLPGVLNVKADAASREFNMRTEWMLRQDVFRDIADHFYVPEAENG